MGKEARVGRQEGPHGRLKLNWRGNCELLRALELKPTPRHDLKKRQSSLHVFPRQPQQMQRHLPRWNLFLYEYSSTAEVQ